jgi:hypothetical protein
MKAKYLLPALSRASWRPCLGVSVRDDSTCPRRRQLSSKAAIAGGPRSRAPLRRLYCREPRPGHRRIMIRTWQRPRDGLVRTHSDTNTGTDWGNIMKKLAGLDATARLDIVPDRPRPAGRSGRWGRSAAMALASPLIEWQCSSCELHCGSQKCELPGSIKR